MSKTYCIFQVYDYKGGELSSSVNLDHDSFIGELSEKFENTVYKLNQDKSVKRDKTIDSVLNDTELVSYKSLLKEAISKELTSGKFYSTYAGGDGFVGEMYCVENGRMSRVRHEQFIDDIVEYINKELGLNR
jgi:hypothetical protein